MHHHLPGQVSASLVRLSSVIVGLSTAPVIEARTDMGEEEQ